MTTPRTQSYGMNDEELGRLAHELLDTLTMTITDEGRLAAITRTLLLAERPKSGAREEAMEQDSGGIGGLPGWEECSAELKATYGSSAVQPSSDPSQQPIPEDAVASQPAWTLKPVLEQAGVMRTFSTQDVDSLITNAPGPLTMCLRRMSSVAASAHLACQWGCFAEAIPLMYWCATSLLTMRSRWTSTPTPDTNRLYVDGALALAAATAAELQHTTLATALIRRLAANLGAFARAGARLEGKPGADPVFAGPACALSSIAGLDRRTAKTGALDLAHALGLPIPGDGQAAEQPG